MNEAAGIHSDPMGVVFRRYRKRIIAAMICFSRSSALPWVSAAGCRIFLRIEVSPSPSR
jgi:hypothetical protein